MPQIFIQLLNGSRITFDVRLADTVKAVKYAIADKSLDGGSVPVDHQRLIFGGKQLPDEQTLSSAGIEDGATVNLVVRLQDPSVNAEQTMQGAASQPDDPPPAPATPVQYSSLFTIRDNPSSGRGLYAAQAIERGTLLDAAPVIVVPRSQYEDHCRHTIFEEYLFNAPNGDRLLALGHGSLFNHARKPNVDYRIDYSGQVIRFIAARKIASGEELCIFYGPDEHLWFDLPPDPEEAAEKEEEDPEGDEEDGEGLLGLGGLSPEALAALQDHLSGDRDGQQPPPPEVSAQDGSGGGCGGGRI